MSAIVARGLQKAFGRKAVLRGLDLAVEEGEVFALIGPSGCGKTTLLRILAGLEVADQGEVATGAPGASLGDGIGFVLQRPAAFRRTVFENVAYGLRLRGEGEEAIAEKVPAALDAVGLGDLAGSKGWTLSAGEAQRMCFARSVVLRPRVLLLDEFTANLDPANVAVLEQALRTYHGETGATVLVVTHNLFQAKRVAARAGLLLDGKIVEANDVESLFTNPRDERTRRFVGGEMPY